MKHTELRKSPDEDEISLLDIIHFFIGNGKFLVATTVGLSAIVIILSLLLPKQYQKQLSLSLKLVPVPLSQPFPGLDPIQISTRAVELLRDRPTNQITPKPKDDAGKISAKAKYDPITQRLDVTLRSPDPNFLSAAPPKIVSEIKSEFQDIVSDSIQNNIPLTELQIKRNQEGLAKLEEQIALLRPSPVSNPQGLRTVARLESLETERVKLLTTIATLKFDKEYLEQAQKKPAEFAAKVISIQILTESSVRPSRSLGLVALLAIIGSFAIAVIAAIVREQAVRLQYELSAQKIEGTKDA